MNGTDLSGHVKKNTIQKNYKHNSKRKYNGYIYNQTKQAKDYKFGGYYSDYNGCGWIAVYNLLKYIGRHKQPATVIRDIESTTDNSNAEGFLMGTQIKYIKKVLKKYKLKYRIYTYKNLTDHNAQKSKYNIVKYYYWIGGHYIFMAKAGKNFYGYNTYSTSKATQADKLGTSFTAWIQHNNYERVTLISISN